MVGRQMTAEERNRRIKHGHDVPRWWIPDFNVPPEPASGSDSHRAADSPSTEAAELSDYRVFKQRKRQLLQREKSRRLNRYFRTLQHVVAVILVVLAFLGFGLPGLLIGACLGLLLISLRLEF